jgi:hypothetical protein
VSQSFPRCKAWGFPHSRIHRLQADMSVQIKDAGNKDALKYWANVENCGVPLTVAVGYLVSCKVKNIYETKLAYQPGGYATSASQVSNLPSKS